MEKIDVLFIAFCIAVFIIAVYISYFKAKTDFILYIINQHTNAIDGLANIANSQKQLSNKQTEINKALIKFNDIQVKINNKFDKHLQDRTVHFPSPTGGRRSEAEA